MVNNTLLFNLLSFSVKWSLILRDLTSVENLWCFGKLVAQESWPPTGGGCNPRFDCSIIYIRAYKPSQL